MREPLILEHAGLTLAFGLDWFPLLGRRGRREAASIVRHLRASHGVLVGNPLAAIGVIGGSPQPPIRVMHSAAQAFGRCHPEGAVVMVRPVPGRGRWLVAVHDGVVVARSDVFLDTDTQVDSLIDELRDSFPGLRVLGGSPDDLPSGLDQLAAACDPSTRLQAMRRPWGAATWLAAPVALAVLLWLGKLAMAPVPAPPVPVKVAVSAVDVQSAWKDAVGRTLAGHGVHGRSGLRAVLDALHAVPAVAGGWLLGQVGCKPLSPTAGQWQCQASYRRGERHASSHTLAVRLGSTEGLVFDGTEQARRQWLIDVPLTPLRDAAVLPASNNDSVWLSRLQALRPGFSRLDVGSFRALPVIPPRDADGLAFAPPAELVRHGQRSLSLTGPLRSAETLLGVASHVAWQSLTLSVSGTARPTANLSALTLSLHGALHETRSISADAP